MKVQEAEDDASSIDQDVPSEDDPGTGSKHGPSHAKPYPSDLSRHWHHSSKITNAAEYADTEVEEEEEPVSPTASWSTQDILCDHFDQKVRVLVATLEAVESKCHLLDSRLVAAEEEGSCYADRLAAADGAAERLRADNEALRQRELSVRQEMSRLHAQLQACKLESALSCHRMQELVEEERRHTDRMRGLRDHALLQRDDALAELGAAHADLDSMQGTIADSAIYVRFLRKQLLELEKQLAAAQLALATASAAAREQQVSGGGLDLGRIRSGVRAAVAEAHACAPDECKKRLRQLQLRWHPDKNPVLTELATEVSKLINEAVTQMEATAGSGSSSAFGRQSGWAGS